MKERMWGGFDIRNCMGDIKECMWGLDMYECV